MHIPENIAKMGESLGLTPELLETALGEPIEGFESSVGSNVGDGYACSIFKADVRTKKEPTKGRHIVLKCYPESESRQAMLDLGKTFEIELAMYDQVIPALNKMLETSTIPIRLPFAPFVYGQHVSQNERPKLGRPFKPMDNCIIMPDMRHISNGSFRLRDRFQGFDLDHHKLVIEGQATLHAVSWAYKSRRGLKNFNQAFPKLDGNFAELWKSFVPFVAMNLKTVGDWVPEFSGSIEHLREVCSSIMGLYLDYDGGQAAKGHTKDNILKNPSSVVENEELWSALQHGDCWNNNLMFRYDEKTNKPVEVIFIDLQVSRDGDPFNDICGSLFMNTEPNLRQKHLTSLLHVYFDRFTQICDALSVPYLPNWNWEEFNRRFHRATIFGAIMATGTVMALKNPEAIKRVEEAMANAEKEKGGLDDDPEKASKKMAELFSNAQKSDMHPAAFERLQCIYQDLFEYNIL